MAGVLGNSRGHGFTYRSTLAGAGNFTTGDNVAAPYWFELVRRGNIFTAYTSPDGATWSALGLPAAISMASNAFVGLVVASTSQNTLNTSVFDNVTVVNSQDFMLSVSPGLVTGSSVQYAVNVSALTGFTAAVNFSLAGFPAGTTYSFAPPSLTPSDSTTLTVTPPGNTPVGV